MTQRAKARLSAGAWRFAGWTVFNLTFAAALTLVVRQAETGVGTIGDIVLTMTIAATLKQSA